MRMLPQRSASAFHLTVGDDDTLSDGDLTAALDFSPAHNEDEHRAVDTQDVDGSHGPLFSVTNPPGTVTVTTYVNGRIQHVALSPSVTKMTEAQLAQEITAVTAIAAIKARAVLHTFVAQRPNRPRRQKLNSSHGTPTTASNHLSQHSWLATVSRC
jgi:hypothetical protein